MGGISLKGSHVYKSPSKDIVIRDMELTKRMTLNVCVESTNELRVRLWLAGKLMRLAAWIAGMGIQFNGFDHSN